MGTSSAVRLVVSAVDRVVVLTEATAVAVENVAPKELPVAETVVR